MKRIKPEFLDTPIFELLVRLALGGVFAYASIHKIMEPASFAKVIYGYYLFPDSTINLIAITLPYIELICALCLMTGVLPVSSSIIISVMLISFMIAISINLIRGHEFDCGCFSVKNSGEKGSPIELLIRDALYLAMSLHIIFFKRKRIFSLFEKM